MPRSRPTRDPKVVIALGLIVLVVLILRVLESPEGPSGTAPAPSDEGYLLCIWNLENLFDDVDDPKARDALEDWFAEDHAALRHKLDLAAGTLLRLGDGRGPDILAMVEVENRRAVELLRDALNARLSNQWRYDQIVHGDNISGRRIEPALLTRLPVEHSATRTVRDFDGRRILEAHLVVDGDALVVLVSHWTSRVTDRQGAKRLAYARALYETYLDREQVAPGLADVLICGDFNDQPDDPSLVQGLRATGSPALVRAEADSAMPRLLNLLAGRDPSRFATYHYRSRPQILDHIVASPGLLDNRGWSIRPETLRILDDEDLRSSRGGPLRFGNRDNQNLRGPSDHFAVTVRLRPPGSDLETVDDLSRIAE